MPKDEFDVNDPMELNGVVLSTEEETICAMAECFTEEYMRMGYNHKQVLALFRNPYYLGMNVVLQEQGEFFVRNLISQVFARWGRPCAWPEGEVKEDRTVNDQPDLEAFAPRVASSQEPVELDPMGEAAPNINL
jgi:hypothetical protein